MKKNLLFTILLFPVLMHSQDVIKLTNGTEMNVKIVGNNDQTISFDRREDLPPYYVAKSEIEEIRYENGTVEKPEHPKLSPDDAKTLVIGQIGTWASDKDGNKLTGSFEGNYLKITADTGDFKKGMVFDLRKLIRFDETSFRREGFAFINIWVPMQTDEAKNEWGKYKFVVRVENHEHATILTASLRQLSKVLKTQPAN